MMEGRGRARSREVGASNPAHSSGFCIGGVSVNVAGACSEDTNLVPSLEPFRIEAGPSDINIQIEWAPNLGSTHRRKVFDSATTWRLYQSEDGFQFDFRAPALGERPYKRLLADNHFSQTILQMSEESFGGCSYEADPLGYPLDELLIMHRLTQEKAIELHGVGIVGPDGASNLFIGHSGAGKSTTARLWTSLHDVKILSDDRIIVREDKVREDKVREDKLREDKAREDATHIFMYGTPWHGEAHFALPDRAPLQRIFVLEHGHGNVLTRLTRSQMVAELFARAFVPFHRHEYVDSALSFLERVADTVPCYRYSFEPDERAVERILKFRD
jgi:hypothetical protein